MHSYTLLPCPEWKDYEMIDCGGGQKLERFGEYILIRPEPQALWDSILPEKDWLKQAHARYISKSSNSGEWEKLKPMPEHWQIKYQSKNLNLCFGLRFTAFKHLGIFPEQAANWEYLYTFLKSIKASQPKVLNLFAYTGGASLAAKAAGADVVHLDSVKQVVNWAGENMKLSGLDNIRWVIEDAARFAEREKRRGNTYHAIIMDPPSYGLGPKGERWKLEDHLNDMLKNVLTLLDKRQNCFIINTYSLNLSSLLLKNMADRISPLPKTFEAGEIFIQTNQKQELPLGSYLRYKNV